MTPIHSISQEEQKPCWWYCCLQDGSTVSMHDATNYCSNGGPILQSSLLLCFITTLQLKSSQQKNKWKNKQMSMKRPMFTSYSSSYHCPVSKKPDCSGWLSDWPQALAGRAGHCEGRLGNELEIGDPTIQTDCSGQKRTNKQLGSESGREDESWEVMKTQRTDEKGSWVRENEGPRRSRCSLLLMSNTAPLLA